MKTLRYFLPMLIITTMASNQLGAMKGKKQKKSFTEQTKNFHDQKMFDSISRLDALLEIKISDVEQFFSFLKNNTPETIFIKIALADVPANTLSYFLNLDIEKILALISRLEDIQMEQMYNSLKNSTAPEAMFLKMTLVLAYRRKFRQKLDDGFPLICNIAHYGDIGVNKLFIIHHEELCSHAYLPYILLLLEHFVEESILWLSLASNQLTILPHEIGQFCRVVRLELNRNNLTVIPEEIVNLVNLQVLDLSYNQLEKLPNSIGNLNSLRALNLNNNLLTVLPISLGKLYNLRKLLFKDNPISAHEKEKMELIFAGRNVHLVFNS